MKDVVEQSSLDKLTCPKWLCAILHVERERFDYGVDISYRKVREKL